MVLLRYLHLFVFVFWYGSLLYFTFLQAPLLFKSLSLETFGLVQSKLFPAYYLTSYVCGGALVVTYHLLHPLRNYVAQDCVKMTALCLMVLFSLGQGLWIGPKVGRLRLERDALRQTGAQTPDAPKLEALNREFRKAHGISSLFNFVVILAGTVYFFYLAKDFQG